MQRLRDHIWRWRIRRYKLLVVKIRKLRAALVGIDYGVHPDVWQEIADDVQRKAAQAERIFQKLDLNPDLKLHEGD